MPRALKWQQINLVYGQDQQEGLGLKGSLAARFALWDEGRKDLGGGYKAQLGQG